MDLKITTAANVLRLKDFLFIIEYLLRYYFFNFHLRLAKKYLLRLFLFIIFVFR